MVKRGYIYVACIWLYVVLDSFFIWNRYEYFFILLSSILVLYTTILLSFKKMVVSDHSIIFPFFSILFYYLWLTINADNLYGFLLRIARFMPLFALLLWPKPYLEDVYKLFRRILIFFAIGSIIVSVLSFIGLIDYIPYYVINSRSALHERQGIVYHVYLCIVTNYSDYDLLSAIPRACGMLQEPGHFSVILGYVYMVDKLVYNRINKWILICGFLTFSPNFILIIVFTEFYKLLKLRTFVKFMGIVLATVLVVFIIFFSLPQRQREEVLYTAYGRNLEMVIDALVSSGSLNEALDERTNINGLVEYERMDINEFVFGANVVDDSMILSDYRGIILRVGLVGLFLLLVAIYGTILNSKGRLKFSLFCILMLVLLHRSWMYYLPYLFFMSYMASRIEIAAFKRNNNPSGVMEFQ